ncbi:MAG: hypothetical protein KJ955_04020 [Nanoarchaeota archaeon]|nr:hypothetical protein [Nanoarchaeota archaeon]
MEGATSRTLVVILVATLFISIFGAVITLERFGGFRALTGSWGEPGSTTYGATNLTISTNLKINFSDDTVNFGSGWLCPACTSARIGTDGTNDTTCNCGWNLPNGLILENVGNRYARINLSNTAQVGSFPGGAGAEYSWQWNNESAVTCTGANVMNLTGNQTAKSNLTAPILTPGLVLCERMNYSLNDNMINISFWVKIMQDSPVTAKNDTWTAVAVDNP